MNSANITANYLNLLSDDILAIIYNNVADLYEKDILLIDNKLNIINIKLELYKKIKGFIDCGSVFMLNYNILITVIRGNSYFTKTLSNSNMLCK